MIYEVSQDIETYIYREPPRRILNSLYDLSTSAYVSSAGPESLIAANHFWKQRSAHFEGSLYGYWLARHTAAAQGKTCKVFYRIRDRPPDQ